MWYSSIFHNFSILYVPVSNFSGSSQQRLPVATKCPCQRGVWSMRSTHQSLQCPPTSVVKTIHHGGSSLIGQPDMLRKNTYNKGMTNLVWCNNDVIWQFNIVLLGGKKMIAQTAIIQAPNFSGPSARSGFDLLILTSAPQNTGDWNGIASCCDPPSNSIKLQYYHASRHASGDAWSI